MERNKSTVSGMIEATTDLLMDKSVRDIITIANPTIVSIKLLLDYIWHTFKEEGRDKFCEGGQDRCVLIQFCQQVTKTEESRQVFERLLDKECDVLRLLDNITHDSQKAEEWKKKHEESLKNKD